MAPPALAGWRLGPEVKLRSAFRLHTMQHDQRAKGSLVLIRRNKTSCFGSYTVIDQNSFARPRRLPRAQTPSGRRRLISAYFNERNQESVQRQVGRRLERMGYKVALEPAAASRPPRAFMLKVCTGPRLRDCQPWIGVTLTRNVARGE